MIACLNVLAACSTADPVYDVPEDIELKEKGSTLKSGPQSNNTSHRHVQYKEEVGIRYEKSANKKQREKKPMMPIATPPITQPGQQSSEKIYQPLIPPKTYKEQEVSAYQDLAFATRDAGTDVAYNSGGQYEPIRKRMMRTISTSPCRLEGVGNLKRGRTNH